MHTPVDTITVTIPLVLDKITALTSSPVGGTRHTAYMHCPATGDTYQVYHLADPGADFHDFEDMRPGQTYEITAERTDFGALPHSITATTHMRYLSSQIVPN